MSTSTQGPQPLLSHRYCAAGHLPRASRSPTATEASPIDDATVTVSLNPPPVAMVNGPYIGNEGAAIAMTSAGSTDPSGGVLTFSWKFGDGGSVDHGESHARLRRQRDVHRDTHGEGSERRHQVGEHHCHVINVPPTARILRTCERHRGRDGHCVPQERDGQGKGGQARRRVLVRLRAGSGATPWSTTIKSVVCPALPDQRPPVTVRGEIRDKDGGTHVVPENDDGDEHGSRRRFFGDLGDDLPERAGRSRCRGASATRACWTSPGPTPSPGGTGNRPRPTRSRLKGRCHGESRLRKGRDVQRESDGEGQRRKSHRVHPGEGHGHTLSVGGATAPALYPLKIFSSP